MNKKLIPLSKKCKYCRKIYFKKVNQSRKDWFLSKYCSRDCKDKDLMGKPSWNKGLHNWWTPNPKGVKRKLTPEWRKKLSDAAKRTWDEKWTKEEQKTLRARQFATGKERGSYKGTLGRKKELSAAWLGDRATYNAKHRWIQENWTKTGVCENCKAKPKPYGKRKNGTEWHNLNQKYDRNKRNDWIELCPKCHKKYG